MMRREEIFSSKIKGDLFVYDFSNLVDVVRLNQVLKDEEVDRDPLSTKVEFLMTEKMRPQFVRNPYVKSKNFNKLKFQNHLENMSYLKKREEKKFNLGGNKAEEVEEEHLPSQFNLLGSTGKTVQLENGPSFIT